MTALRVRSLSVKRGARDILRAVDLDVAAGEIVALLGPSGAGKSTLFAAVVGDLRPSAGSVFIGGDDLGALPSWKRARLGLAYLPQGPSVLWDLSAHDNLATFASLANLTIDVAAHLDRFGLAARAPVAARSLSGGERRRLELARSLLTSPRVLLCDEPFTGLHPAAIADLAPLLRAAATAGAAVLIADHHAKEALALASRAVLLVDGEVVATTAASEFLGHPAVSSRYLAPIRDIHLGE